MLLQDLLQPSEVLVGALTAHRRHGQLATGLLAAGNRSARWRACASGMVVGYLSPPIGAESREAPRQSRVAAGHREATRKSAATERP